MKNIFTKTLVFMLLMFVAAISSAWAQDVTKPTLPSDPTITVTGKTHNSISISWNAATDNSTPQDQLRYGV